MRAIRSISGALLLAACLASTVHAAGAVVPRGRTARSAPPVARHAAPRVAKPAAARDSSRTLDPIHIEGELDVPEVLFITARDQRRIVEFQHRRYLGTSAAALHATPARTRLVVDRGAPPAVAGDPR